MRRTVRHESHCVEIISGAISKADEDMKGEKEDEWAQKNAQVAAGRLIGLTEWAAGIHQLGKGWAEGWKEEAQEVAPKEGAGCCCGPVTPTPAKIMQR